MRSRQLLIKSTGRDKKINPFHEVSFDNQSVRVIYFYDYIGYDPYKQTGILKNNTGWKAPLGRESRMDCYLHAFDNWQTYNEKGMTNDGFTLSVLVRNQLASREEALEKEQSIVSSLEPTCRQVCKDLGVDFIGDKK